MRTIKFTDFRRSASAILDLVEKGEAVRILRHGTPIAKIVPAEQGQPKPAWKQPGPSLIVAGTSVTKTVLEPGSADSVRFGVCGLLYGTADKPQWVATVNRFLIGRGPFGSSIDDCRFSIGRE